MMIEHEAQWDAVRRRDRASDGSFVYGVLTTGVYCRPSCPSRRPLRRNVRFYASPAEAERDGLRACLRCRPQDAEPAAARRLRDLCDYIGKHCEERLPLEDLARRAGVSPYHLQRTFKAALGVSPRQYQEAARTGALKRSLRQARSVTEAGYEAGLGSSSRLYERTEQRLGMTPGQYRAGGGGLSISYVSFRSPLGLLMLGATDRGLCFAQFGGSEDELVARMREEYPRARLEPVRQPDNPALLAWRDALASHLEGRAGTLDVPVDVAATAFQVRVWNYLRTIPRGETRSYAQVAEGVGRPSAARAVAQACAANRVAIAIPCHRVIRGSGALGGYRWGVARKEALLRGERAAAQASMR